MLLYKDGRFWGKKVAFLLPDGFYLEDTPDRKWEHGFCAWSPQRDYRCSWRLCRDCAGTAAELERWLSPEFGFTPLSEVAPLEVNGLSGHFLLYENHRKQYYEARFDLGDGEEFVFEAETWDRPIRQVAASPEFRAALEGIRAYPACGRVLQKG